MELEHTFKLSYWLGDCPSAWKNFRQWHDSHSTNWEQALNIEYNAIAISNDPENIFVIFPTQEKKAQFLLTWG